MNQQDLKTLLESIQSQELSIEDGVKLLSQLPFQDLGYAKVDHHRELRQGYPEVIYCAGKTPDQVEGIVKAMLQRGSNILATRAEEGVFQRVKALTDLASYHPLARTITIVQNPVPMVKTSIAVVTGGTSDIPVAEEAAITAEIFGNPVERIYDVGVAGIHRLLAHLPVIQSTRVIVAVAGMEGALASVLGGMVNKPIIAVPTSVGYGANFGGLAALLSMLNSCASGTSVVNIDNGFGAGYMASMINHL